MIFNYRRRCQLLSFPDRSQIPVSSFTVALQVMVSFFPIVRYNVSEGFVIGI